MYFYKEKQQPEHRTSHMATVVQISESGVIVLNIYETQKPLRQYSS